MVALFTDSSGSIAINDDKLMAKKDVISLVDQSGSIAVRLGEKVTVRIEESLDNGLMWSYLLIDGDGLTRQASRSMTDDETRIEYRKFVLQTHRTGGIEFRIL